MRADTKGTAKMEMVEFLLKIPDAFVFKNIYLYPVFFHRIQKQLCSLFFLIHFGRLFFININAEEKMSQIFKRFEEGWGAEHDIYVRPYWLYMPDSKVVDVLVLDPHQCLRRNKTLFLCRIDRLIVFFG